jgi:hypothetical protein
MATGENILWIVEKKQVSGAWESDKPWAKPKRFVFRTLAAAKAFVEKKRKNNRNRHMMYYSPLRATWGPEQ